MNALVFMNEVVLACVEGFIIFYAYLYFIDKLCFLKKNKLKTALCLITYTCFSYWSTMHVDYSIHTFLYMLFTICLFSYITGTNIYKSAISVFLIFIIYSTIELFFVVIITNVTGIPVSRVANDQKIDLLSQLIIRPVQFLIFLTISHFKLNRYLKKYNILNRNNSPISYLLLQMIAMFILLSNSSRDNDSVLAYSVTGLIFLIITIFGILYFIEYMKSLKLENQFALQKEYITNMELVLDVIRKEKHDYLNHVSTLVAMCSLKSPDSMEKIEHYARKLINNSESDFKFFDTGNKYLDGFLAIKSSKAVENDIYLEVDFESPLSSINIDEIDFTSIIGNILDNAIDAVLLNSPEKKKIISVYAYKEADNYFIAVSNNGPQIFENDLKRIFEMKYSTKEKNSIEHGFGLYIAKELAAKNKGKITVRSTEQETEFLIEFKVSG
ncbi:MAG: ATP-binding protein [Bacillota bacterium]|nr:ATP-binding protein [Bacillota bacterium]